MRLVDRSDAIPDAEAQMRSVYDRAFAAEDGGPSRDFLDGQLRVHRDREGFAIVGALDGERLVGFAYGYRGNRGQWWTDRIAAAAPAAVVADWLGGHFEVVEVAVVPEARGRGVGAAVLSRLVEDRPERRALLTTWRTEHPARRLYARLGWRELASDVLGSSLWGLELAP